MFNYDKSKRLDDRSKAREKLSIWYGSNDNFQHGLREVVANAADEVINNFEKGQVLVELHKDLQTITVTDTGRGMPIFDADEIENLFLTLFAGTKLDATEKTTTGTNGVGLTVLNYTSLLMEVKTAYGNGKGNRLKFVNGGDLVEQEELTFSHDKHGTEITWKLDPEIYTHTTYTVEDVKEIAKMIAVSSNKITVLFKYKEYSELFHYECLEEYFNELTTNNVTANFVGSPRLFEVEHKDTKKDENPIEKNTFEIAFAASQDPVQQTFLNMTFLSEHGKIYDGILDGMRKFINDYLAGAKLYKAKEKPITTKDVEQAVSFVCSALSTHVSFSNQTKFSTKKDLYKTQASKYVYDLLMAFKVEQPKDFKILAEQCLAMKRANERSTDLINKAKKTLGAKPSIINNNVPGFVDCKKKKGGELYIAEGNSALGSIVAARNAEFQAAIPLKGKILNALKASYGAIFDNAVLVNLLKVLECGIETDKRHKDLDMFDMNNLRWENIFIATDADDDGAHITCLVLTALYRMVPSVIKAGKVHIVHTPLFEIRDLKTDELFYAFTEEEKDEIAAKIPKHHINRNKGLGEVNPETMAYSAMDPQTRTTTQVTIEDCELANQWFDILMGERAYDRKQYVEQNLAEYLEY